MAHKVAVATIGSDADVHLLFLAILPRVNLAIIAIAECSILRNGEETDGILLMARNLLFALAINAALPYIEGTIALAQIIERLAISSPYGGTVFTTEISELGELIASLQPDITRDSRLMVLAEEVLVALVVVIEHIALGIDADVLH